MHKSKYLKFILICISLEIYAEELNYSFDPKKKFVDSIYYCLDVKKIEGEIFCVKESKITLNSCGKQSDWPCLEEDGCLEIERLVKQ